MKYYAILPKEYIDTDDGKDYHVFEATLVKDFVNGNYIKIIDSVFDSHTAKNKTFRGLNKFDLKCGNTAYVYVRSKDNVYYGNKDAIRIIAAHILKEKMCGQCIATLY